MDRSIFLPTKKSDVAVVCGEAALDGSNPTPIATGLQKVLGVVLTLKGSAAPGDATSALTYDNPVGGAFNVYGWRNTGGTDPTLVASTGAETFSWLAVGY